MSKRKGAVIRTKKYERFRGVDFSTDPALVDDARSPWAPNMISDMGGMPEKRPGWRTLRTFDGRINGLFEGVFNGTIHRLVHAGTKLYRWYTDGTAPAELTGGLPDARSAAVYMSGSLWLFTGAGLYRYNGTQLSLASDGAYIPLTIISRAPSGGGVSYEAVNLLTPRQRVSFLADGQSTVYKLPYQDISSVDLVQVGGITQHSGYWVDCGAGTVTFTTAPAAPAAGAEDNVIITFSKTLPGNTDRINKCRTAVAWGVGAASDRIIATGNPDYPNYDFTSGYADGTYWPDTGYAVIGTDETAILGYRRLGEYLAVVKEDNGQDSTVFLRASTMAGDGEAVFPVKPCIAGAGAVTRFGFGNIGDEQLILTGHGICALTTNSLTAERVAQNRSYRIDPKLLSEDLSEAVSCSYDGSYLVFVGGRVYGLDGRQVRSYASRNDTSFVYECFSGRMFRRAAYCARWRTDGRRCGSVRRTAACADSIRTWTARHATTTTVPPSPRSGRRARTTTATRWFIKPCSKTATP